MRFLVSTWSIESLGFIFSVQIREVALLHFFVAVSSLLLGKRYSPWAAEQVTQEPGDWWDACHDAQQGQKAQEGTAGNSRYVDVRHACVFLAVGLTERE